MLRFFILFTLFITRAHALQVQWFGTSCIAISSKNETLLFDPFFDHPSVLKTISPFSYEPSLEESRYWLKKLPKDHTLVGIFSSHSHYDHILDAPHLLKDGNIDFYGSKTAIEIVINDKNKARLHELKSSSPFQVGSFKITAYPGVHPPHVMGVTLAAGKLDHPLEKPTSMASYKMGEVYNFKIEHPEGTILFYPSAYVSDQTPIDPVDLLILGVANRKSSEELISKVVLPSKAKELITVHHDDLFKPLDRTGKVHLMFPSDYQEWQEGLKKLAPKLNNVLLQYGESFILEKKTE